MRTYKILGLLLDYPNAEMLSYLDEFETVLKQEKLLPRAQLKAVIEFIRELRSVDLYQLQEQYVLTFDRGRSHCLHMFEHVYGESRDRGQAMVDLANAYEEKGLYINRSELPDYIPLFLEFLSMCSAPQAQEWLGEPVDIFASIAARLHKNESFYAAIFDSLVALSKVKPNKEKLNEVMSLEIDDTSLEAIDKEWEEAAAFGGQPNQSDCGNCAANTGSQHVSIN